MNFEFFLDDFFPSSNIRFTFSSKIINSLLIEEILSYNNFLLNLLKELIYLSLFYPILYEIHVTFHILLIYYMNYFIIFNKSVIKFDCIFLLFPGRPIKNIIYKISILFI